MKFNIGAWVEYTDHQLTRRGEIIDYLIDDDDEEYLLQDSTGDLQWVAGVVLRPVEGPSEEPPATEPQPLPDLHESLNPNTEPVELCPHDIPDGVGCMICDTDGAAEAQGY